MIAALIGKQSTVHIAKTKSRLEIAHTNSHDNSQHVDQYIVRLKMKKLTIYSTFFLRKDNIVKPLGTNFYRIRVTLYIC